MSEAVALVRRSSRRAPFCVRIQATCDAMDGMGFSISEQRSLLLLLASLLHLGNLAFIDDESSIATVAPEQRASLNAAAALLREPQLEDMLRRRGTALLKLARFRFAPPFFSSLSLPLFSPPPPAPPPKTNAGKRSYIVVQLTRT
eukprot:4478569-Pleurochrysis_carterae.AAC.5